MTPLGVRARDRISGFEGVVTGRCEYITGCNQALLSPTVGANGDAREPHWFDEQRLVITDEARLVLDNGEAPGPDKPAPIR